jgi:hypothetical protein
MTADLLGERKQAGSDAWQNTSGAYSARRRIPSFLNVGPANDKIEALHSSHSSRNNTPFLCGPRTA